MSPPSGFMAPFTGRRMLDELWRLVFEELLVESGDSATVVPLLQVCKAWKACGSSLLYRHVQFSGTAQLKAFYEHLFFHANDGRYPGLYSQTLTIHTPAVGFLELSHHVPRILGYLHNLRAFHAPDIDICSTILEPLAVVAQRTLHELSLTLCSSESDGAINLAIVSRFTGLKNLKVTVNWGADSTIFAIGRAIGFRMPFLTALCWSSPRVAPVHEFIVFLTRCDLPALTNLELDFPFLTTEGTASLQPVFKKFGPQLRHLSYNVPGAARLPQTVFALLPNLQRLEVHASAAALDIIRVLPDMTEEVRVAFDLLQFAQDWLLENPSDTCLRRIRLTANSPQRFDWRTFGLLRPIFAGELLTVSFQLAGRGVHLLDGSGNTVVMVSSPVVSDV